MNNTDQGTIFYGLRSPKYPEIPSYAVIISARCDIANNKISKLYYLTAIDALDWFCTRHGYHIAFSQQISSFKTKLTSIISKYNLNTDLIVSFDKEEAITVLKYSIKDERDLSNALKDYEELYKWVRTDASFESRKVVIRNFDEKRKKKTITDFLSDISSGKTYHYHFIPQKAYSELEEKSSGLIVDLQEIGIMSMEEAEAIFSPGIDYQTLKSETKLLEKVHLSRETMLEKYWMETEDDFVFEVGCLKSPWCELLLQRFALDFIRIGVDGSTSLDYEHLALNVGKER